MNSACLNKDKTLGHLGVNNVMFFLAALFGEGPPERRDRLRILLSELGKN